MSEKRYRWVRSTEYDSQNVRLMDGETCILHPAEEHYDDWGIVVTPATMRLIEDALNAYDEVRQLADQGDNIHEDQPLGGPEPEGSIRG